MEHLSVFIPQNAHVGLHFDVLPRQTVNHPLQGLYLLVLFPLVRQQHVHLQLHPVEIVHELGQTLTAHLVGFRCLF